MDCTNLSKLVSNIILFFVVYFIIVPLTLSVLIPLLIFRRFATLTAKCVPGTGRLLSPMSSYFAVDEMYKDPLCTLITSFTTEGKINRTAVLDRVTELINQNKCPELTQTLSTWMGFYCWKKTSSFRLENLIQFIPERVDHSTSFEMRKSLAEKVFEEGKPLWQLVIFEHYVPEIPEVGKSYSMVVLRFHHSLVDGYSMLNLLQHLTGQPFQDNMAKPEYSKRGFCGNVGFWTKLILWGPFTVFRTISDSTDQNAWKISPDKIQGVLSHWETHQVSLQDLKRISKSRGVRVSSVIYAAFTGAIRNSMISSGFDIPEKFTIICPFPLPSHPDYLTNKMTVIPIPVPVFEPNPLKRLEIMESTLKDMKTSIIPRAFAGMINIAGLIASLVKVKKESTMGTFLMSNFPGPPTKLNLFGLEATDLSFFSRLQNSAISIGGYSISYDSNLVLGVGADASLFPDTKTAREFMNLVMNEFEVFKSGIEDEMV